MTIVRIKEPEEEYMIYLTNREVLAMFQSKGNYTVKKFINGKEVEIGLDRGSLIHDDLVTIPKTDYIRMINSESDLRYKYEQLRHKMHKSDTYLYELRHWQNKYNCVKEEYETLLAKVKEKTMVDIRKEKKEAYDAGYAAGMGDGRGE